MTGVVVFFLILLQCAPPVTGLPEEPGLAYGMAMGRAILRSDPFYLASQLDMLENDSRLQILKKKNAEEGSESGWYYVRTEEDLEGWIYEKEMEVLGEEAPRRAVRDTGAILRRLIGKWWQVSDTGQTGYLKIYFWADGSYRDGYGDQFTGGGRYEIHPGEERIEFRPASRVGESVSYRFLGKEMRLVKYQKARNLYFRRGHSDPDAPEGMANGEEEAGAGGEENPDTRTEEP